MCFDCKVSCFFWRNCFCKIYEYGIRIKNYLFRNYSRIVFWSEYSIEYVVRWRFLECNYVVEGFGRNVVEDSRYFNFWII